MDDAGRPFFERLGTRSAQRLGWRRAAVVVAFCALLSEILAPHADLQDVIMVYFAGVVYVALHEGLRTSVATVLASIFLFDLLVVPPRWSVQPLHASHIVTLGVMLAVGLLISSLSSRAHLQTVLADRRAQRANALSELAAELSTARSTADIEAVVSRASSALLGTPCRLSDDGSLQFEPRAEPFSGEEADLAQALGRQARLALERHVFEQRSSEAMVAAESERLRNMLLSGISHDFRTPLTTLIGAATVLIEQGDRIGAERRRSLEQGILDEARRLHEQLSHLLDLTRLEEGQVQVRAEWCPADDLVTETLQALGDRGAAHRIAWSAPADAVVWCDPRLVQQALANLLDNALRHTPAGGAIRIGVALDADAWLLSVADEGPGLPPGDLHDMFRKFHRGQAEPASTGFGLGLAICAAIARLHGGSIEARNEGGALITLRLPQPARDERETEA